VPNYFRNTNNRIGIMAQILKFPVNPENCREAFFVKDNIWFALMAIDVREMDKLITAQKRFNMTFTPFPAYFDRTGRIFPNWNYNKSQIVYR
jgi:hypothetical protein